MNTKELKDVGRALGLVIHDKPHDSYLSASDDNISLRGLVNLLVLILLSYTIRAVI